MISIIIPCYNSQDFLEECLDSIINQSYSDWEAICINDGSIDQTESILKKYCNIDTRIKYYNQENKGVSAARNFALKKSSGDYICFVDSDDTIEVNYLSELYSLMLFSDGLSIGNFTRSMLSVNSKQTSYSLTSDEFIKKIIYDKKFCPQICCMLFKNSLIKKNNLNFIVGCTRGEDREFFLKYVIYIDKVQYSEKIIYHYRINGNSAMSSFNEKSLTSLDASVRLYRYYKERQHILSDHLQKSLGYAILKFLILTTLYKKTALYDAIKNKYNVSELLTPLDTHPSLIVKLTVWTYRLSEKLFKIIFQVIGVFYRLNK